MVDVVHVVVFGGELGVAALPPVPGSDGVAGVPASAEAVEPVHSSPNLQLKPEPQSLSAVHGSSYFGVHCLGAGSQTMGGQFWPFAHSIAGHAPALG
jgi:hypothetical protein